MAKYNMMLGVASGSVGDIVLSRQNGMQIQRVRVREVSNPKTEAQAAQRSYIAPVTKFYSPYAIALERSWEGYNKGKSYSQFLKFNTQLARDNEYALPKGCGFFPLPFRVSKGSLPTMGANYTYSDGDGIIQINAADLDVVLPAMTIGNLSASMIRAGYKLHDQITILYVIQRNQDDVYAQDAFQPEYIRFYLDPNSTKPISDFGFDASVASSGIHWLLAKNMMVAAAIILSRYERGVWRRSTEVMEVKSSLISFITTPEQRKANIDTYRPPTSANPSDIYLNGAPANAVQLQRQTRAGVDVTIVGLLRTEDWTVAVSSDSQTYYVYCNERASPAFHKCLAADGSWATNEEATEANSIAFNFISGADNAQENLLFFMDYGFTYVQLLPFA